MNGQNLGHYDLSRLIATQLQGLVENPEWWAQSITVAYEQSIGKRIPGQLANGLFELAVSKTIAKSRDLLFAQVVEWFESHEDFDGESYSNPRKTVTPKRSNWRCDFDDGSKFAVTVEGNELKSKLVFSHTALPNKAVADQRKAYWTQVITDWSAKV